MITASYLCIPYPSERTFTPQEWEESCPLDAPDCLLTGSFIRYEYQSIEGFAPLPDVVSRGATWT